MGQIQPPASKLATRRLAKHQFSNEAELVDSLWRVLESEPSMLLGGETVREVFMQREWDLGIQIADLLLANRPEAPLAWHNALAEYMKTTSIERFVLARIMEESSSLEGLLKRIFSDKREIEASVLSLEMRGLVRRNADGQFQTTDGWTEWIPKSLHFLEAKMDDWREAINQAVFYRRFGHAASVALPSSFQAHKGVLAACLERGVGLILVAPCGTPDVVLRGEWSHTAPRLVETQLKVLRRILRQTNGYQTGMPVADLQETDLPLWQSVEPLDEMTLPLWRAAASSDHSTTEALGSSSSLIRSARDNY